MTSPDMLVHFEDFLQAPPGTVITTIDHGSQLFKAGARWHDEAAQVNYNNSDASKLCSPAIINRYGWETNEAG